MKKLLLFGALVLAFNVFGQEKEIKLVSEYLENLDAHYSGLQKTYKQNTKKITEEISRLNEQNVLQSQIIEKEKNSLNAFKIALNDLNKYGVKKYFKISDSKSISNLEKITKVSNVSHALLKRGTLGKTEEIHALFICNNNQQIEVKSFDYVGNKKILKIISSKEKSGLQPVEINKDDISTLTNARAGLTATELMSKNLEQIENLKKDLLKFDPKKIDSLKKSDKTKLFALKKYYEIDFPSAKADYEYRLNNAIEIDKKNMKDYEQRLSAYEKVAGESTKMPTEAEAINYFNVFKKALKDPYSAILETYGVKPLAKTNEAFPCIKCVILGVRAKNSWGAYGLSKYYVFVKNGEVIDFMDSDKNDYMMDYTTKLAFEMSNVTCDGTGAVKPVKPTSEAAKISEPNMEKFNFAYSE